MPNIYDSVTQAIASHWKAHDNRYPQKIVLTPDQRARLNEHRRIGRLALGIHEALTEPTFLGVLIEEDAGTPGVLVAVDGTQVPLVAA